jgi:LuxR family maltose regulon positive regulatory protein
MVDRVLSELTDERSNLTLVIDDLHELTSPGALAQLSQLMMNLPPHVHAILSTRHDVQLRLHQLRLVLQRHFVILGRDGRGRETAIAR